MLPRFIHRSVLLAVLAGSVIAQGEAPSLLTPPQSELPRFGPLESETLAKINAYRARQGLPLFRLDPVCTALARAHSQAMAAGRRSFGHDGFSQRVSQLRQAFALRGAGENVFLTDPVADPARLAVESWLKSPPHLANIRGQYNLTGIGVAANRQGVLYFTEIFALKAIASSP